MPNIEKPLKEIVRQNNFLGLSTKMARRETSEWRRSADLWDFDKDCPLGTIIAIYIM